MFRILAAQVNLLRQLSLQHLLQTVIVLAVIWFLLGCLRRVVAISWLYKTEKVFLELTPSIYVNKPSVATEQLFKVIHGLNAPQSLWEKLIGQRSTLALEITSSKEQGIRFIAGVPAADQTRFEQALHAYLPEMHVGVLSLEPFAWRHTSLYTKLLSFRQTKHYAYSLRLQRTLDQYDPIAYLLGAMTRLEPEEQIRFQLILSAAPTHLGRWAANRLQKGHLPRVSARRGPLNRLIHGFVVLLTLPIRLAYFTLIGWLFGYRASSRSRLVTGKHFSDQEQMVADSIGEKLAQPLFYTQVRALVIARTVKATRERRKGLRTALTSFRVPRLQSLRAQSSLSDRLTSRLQAWLFGNYLPGLRRSASLILSSSEVAAIFHFPDRQGGQVENVHSLLSRNLPAPIALKASSSLAITFGVNIYHGVKTAIGLSEEERKRHLYIVGGTGNGKSTVLLSAIVEDIRAGRGVALIDPHGDLAETVLRYIPEARLNDVVYFNPDDLEYPLGLNMLELPAGLHGRELMRERDLVTESVVMIFRKLFSDDDSGGHRIEYVLRNAIQTALRVPDATLFTVYRLLNDPIYQKTIVKQLKDRDLQNFWWNELGKAGDYQRVKMAAGVTAKIGRFLFSASARQILEQKHSTLDLDDILATEKILICNVSKGKLGEDTAALFGTTVLARLQIATLRRARLSESRRRPFYLYVDEFQNFATTSFVQMLSEARKYQLFLTMAEQSTAQQAEQRMVEVILANVGTVVCFRTASPRDEQLLLPLFKPFIHEGELASLPAYHFYLRNTALQPSEPLSGETVLLSDSGSVEIGARVVLCSRERYGGSRTAPTEIPEVRDRGGVKETLQPIASYRNLGISYPVRPLK